MFSATKFDRHALLVNRMAGALGVDLGDALIEARLSPEGLRGAVLRCAGCDCPEACAHWLEGHRDGATAAPDYCRNRALLAGLGGHEQ